MRLRPRFCLMFVFVAELPATAWRWQEKQAEPDQDLAAYLSFETEDSRFYAARNGGLCAAQWNSVAAFCWPHSIPLQSGCA